ncbi:IclR family transcriptional regulator [Sphingomonas colocasiae]|uniref:IclR family transcriptional regulator n=1 Tax=Sphingomonas colocasiae TaxID=1848973 RepID=A0ABS7PUS7_9SPHN|nr:IclR family transcriptional regulator [Sphingomonas colocasiae]MBY8823754.1 IclR family transcriptional regulator [Sphingomonas colocasiae]
MSDRDLRRQSPTIGLGNIESVATAANIIDLLAERGSKVSVQDVADILGITKSRASRHLTNLEELGLVGRQGSRGYELGWRLMRWGQIAARRMDIGMVLDEHLTALGRETQLTVLLCTPADGDAVVVRTIPAPQAIHINVEPGLVLGLPDSPSARIVFAFLPKEAREARLEHLCTREASFRIGDRAEFMEQVSKIQRDYYCWTRDKFNLGHGALAAPVFDQGENLSAVVTLMVPRGDLAEHGPSRAMLQSLIRCCAQSSRRLGSRLQYPGVSAG